MTVRGKEATGQTRGQFDNIYIAIMDYQIALDGSCTGLIPAKSAAGTFNNVANHHVGFVVSGRLIEPILDHIRRELVQPSVVAQSNCRKQHTPILNDALRAELRPI